MEQSAALPSLLALPDNIKIQSRQITLTIQNTILIGILNRS